MTYYTTTSAAQELGISPIYVRKLIYTGVITATKHGRDWLIHESQLEVVRNRRR